MKLATVLLLVVVVLYVTHTVNAQRGRGGRPGGGRPGVGRPGGGRPGGGRPGGGRPGGGRPGGGRPGGGRPGGGRPTRRSTRRPTRRTTRGGGGSSLCVDICPNTNNRVCGTTFRRGSVIRCNFNNRCQVIRHGCLKREVWVPTDGNCSQKSRARDCA